jgi:DNA-directed RNA polymerase specialized sigma24 family protein
VIPDAKAQEPEQVAMRLALWDAIIDAVMTVGLSDLEASILLHRLQDCSYQQIADKLGRRAKAIDNGLQRWDEGAGGADRGCDGAAKLIRGSAQPIP